MTETSNEPINGAIQKTEWIDSGAMIAWVEGPDGDMWTETYEFVEAEKVE